MLRLAEGYGRVVCIAVDIMMLRSQHQGMRTALTLDDDVDAKLKAESRRAGRPFRDNETLRRGMATWRLVSTRQPFKVTARDRGDLRAWLALDIVAQLIEEEEGS